MLNPIKTVKNVDWLSPRKRRWYFALSIIALAALCGVGTSLKTAAHQDWHQVLKSFAVGLLPYATALLKVVLVYFIALLARDKATAFAARVAGRLPEHNTFRAAVIGNSNLIHWLLATVVAVYVVDKMLMAYVFFALYVGYKLLSKYVDDIAAGFALISTAKVRIGQEITIESGATDVTGELLEVALFYSTVKVGETVRKVQNSSLWQNWIESRQSV